MTMHVLSYNVCEGGEDRELGIAAIIRQRQPPGYTYPSAAPWLRLDYIFASPLMAAQLTACDVIRGETAKQASDHFPIWAEFR